MYTVNIKAQCFFTTKTLWISQILHLCFSLNNQHLKKVKIVFLFKNHNLKEKLILVKKEKRKKVAQSFE